jgi:hypothetical protein
MLDLTRVTVRLLPNNTSCTIDVRAPNGFRVAQLDCGARMNLGSLWTCADGDGPTKRSFRTFLLDIFVVGECPHRHRRIVGKLVESLAYEDEVWRTDMALPLPQWEPEQDAPVQRQRARGRRAGNAARLVPAPPRPRCLHLVPDAHGTMPFAMPFVIGWSHVLDDNFRAKQPTDMHAEWYTDMFVFPITGREMPVRTRMSRGSVVYDFAAWVGETEDARAARREAREQQEREQRERAEGNGDGNGDENGDENGNENSNDTAPAAPAPDGGNRLCDCSNPRLCALVTHAVIALQEGLVYISGLDTLDNLQDLDWLETHPDTTYGSICGFPIWPDAVHAAQRDKKRAFVLQLQRAIEMQLSRALDNGEAERQLRRLHILDGRAWRDVARRRESGLPD